MSEVETVETVETEVVQAVPEVVVAVPAPVEIPEQVYTYQPVDEQGRPLGGKQVIKYKTTEELTQKLTDQNIRLVRELREQTKKNRLGVQETNVIPEDALKFNTPLEFIPRQLTPDERVQLSRDLLDPERFEEASSTLFEATVGAKPDVLRNTLTRLSQNELAILAKVESDAFMSQTPDYFPCRENFETLADWMVKNDLQPVRQNFQLAFETLRGVMIDRPEIANSQPAPVVAPEPVVEPVAPVVEPVQEPVPEPVVPKTPPPPTGLREQGVNVLPPKKSKYTLADINKMSAEEYKKRFLHEKGFAQAVEALEREVSERRRANNR